MGRGGAGRFRHKVRIQAMTEARGSDGGLTVTYVDRFEDFALIQPLKQEERVEARNVKGITTHNVEMRYRPGIMPTDRVVWGDRKFNVEGVWTPMERGIHTMLVVVEISEVVGRG